MENWGLITYRETALLVQEGVSSIASKQRVAYVVGHELAHQWFGNLVTMEWWNNLWLNEGFATFIGTQVVDVLFPHWDSWTQFVSTDFFHALELDALESSHPIEVDVSIPDEVNEIFDAISYSKGASVIRMLANFLGEEAFRRGLNIYLNRFLYGNAVTEDLWAALSEASGFDVASAMNCWVKRIGYPMLSVRLTPSHIHLTQERMLSSGKNVEDQPWWMPILISSNASHVPTKLELKEKAHSIPHTGSDLWMKVNLGQTGIYRVKYDDTLSQKIEAVIKSKELSATDRLGVQNDAFALAQSGYSRTSTALAIALAYTEETNCAVWSDLVTNIGVFTRIWHDEPVIDKIRAFRRALYSTAAAKVGWVSKPDEGDLTTRLRALLLRSMVDSWDTKTLEEANAKFDEWQLDSKVVTSDLLGTLFSAVMITRPDAFSILRSVYLKLTMQDQRVIVLGVLGATKDKALAYQILDWTKDSGEVRQQDFYIVVNTVASHHTDVAWTWMMTNWDWVEKTFSPTIMLFGRIVSLVINKFHSEKDLAGVKSFFEKHKGPEMTIKQGYETISTQAAWLARDRDDVAKWLEKKGF